MIEVTCGACHHDFLVSAMRAGVRVLCQSCGVPVNVPKPGDQEPGAELVGASVTQAAQSSGGGARGATGGTPRAAGGWAAGEEQQPAEWHDEDFNAMDDASRHFKPFIEDDLRRGHLFKIGLALTIAFLAPIAGAPGHALYFSQFSAFPGMSLAGLLILLPLFAGLILMVISKKADLPLRGIVTFVAGAALFGLMLVDPEARATIGESVGAVPTSVNLSGALAILGMFGLLVSIRVRWYRPLSRRAYVIGLVAAGCYISYLFLSVNGRMPIEEPLQVFRMHKLMGIGMFGHVGLMAAAAILCLINLPNALASTASTKAGRAFLCMAGALVVPVLMMMFSAMSMSSSMPRGMSLPGMDMGSPAMMFISAAVKFGVMYGGLALLIPIGIADLLVGRPFAGSGDARGTGE
jgi:hypothetical protein